MELLALLTKLFGPTMARILFAVALKDRVELAAIGSGDMAETLADSLNIGGIVDKLTDGDRRARVNSEYVFEKIGDEAAEKLSELFRHERVSLSEAERDSAVEAAKDTLNRRALPLLVETNLEPHRFRRALSSEPPSIVLSMVEEDLYKRLLNTCAQLVFAMADKLPYFTRDTTAQLLQNENRLLSDMRQALDNQQRILEQTYGRQHASQSQVFEGEYRTTLATELDQLKLFGIRMFDGAKQPLSVAFIKLQVSFIRPELENREEGLEEISEGGRLATAESIAREALATGASIVVKAGSRVGKSSLLSRFVTHEPVSVEEALTTSDRLLVVAGAGSGKTTLLRWVAVQAAQNFPEPSLQGWQGRVPFFVQLRDFAGKALPTFGKLAMAAPGLETLADSEPDKWTVTQLREKRGLVLVDGLDEINASKREETLTWIERLLKMYPETIVIQSTRPSALEDEATQARLQKMGFQRADLQKMEGEMIDNFIQQWHAAMGNERCLYPDKMHLPEREEALLKSLGARSSLRDLVKTPLLCAMLCALHLEEIGKLPQDRVQLYDACILMLLKRDEKREVDVSDYGLKKLRPKSSRAFLASLAFWMMENDVATIGRADAERILNKAGYDGAKLATYLSERTGILQQQALDEFDFIHRTFQEFLAAQHIVEDHRVKPVVRQFADKSEWRETICLLAGYARAEDQARLLEVLFDLAEQEQEQARSLHLLAWEFWELLDTPATAATTWVEKHVAALLGENAFLSLSSTQVSDLKPLQSLTNLQSLDLRNTQVSDLKPLQSLTNLQSLDLSSTQVSDLKPLQSLTNLQSLYLMNTQVSDLKPLQSLTNLQSLYLMNTQVSDLKPLQSLTNLQSLDLRNTQVSDLKPLQSLTNLQSLDLMNTQVSDISPLAEMISLHKLTLTLNTKDISNLLPQLVQLQNLKLRVVKVEDPKPLQSLTNLQSLDLMNTQVSDLKPLQSLTNLQSLDLSSTQVSDLKPLQSLTNLQSLYLSSTQVSDLKPLQSLTNLQSLDLMNTQVSDLKPLQSLTNLQSLDLRNTQVSDLKPLQSLTNLQSLYLMNTQVSDLKPLQSLTNLQSLDLRNTQVSDLKPLQSLTNLQSLYLMNTQVSDLKPLQSLTNLQSLDLRNTQVSDLKPLQSLTNLQSLYLMNTQVSDLKPLQSLTNLQSLDLMNTQVSDLKPLQSLTNLQSLDLRNTQVSDLKPLQSLTNLQSLDLRNTQVSDVSLLDHLTRLRIFR